MSRLRSQEGWALVIAMMVMATMLVIGAAALALVDQQQLQTRLERGRESSFNLAEGALNLQAFVLSRSWPSATNQPAAGTCSQASTDIHCPTQAAVSASFGGVDYGSAPQWTTAVYDDGGSIASYYSDVGAATQPHYDVNGNGLLWVRSSGTVNNRTRVLVARVKVVTTPVQFPRNVALAGVVTLGGNGIKKPIIDTNGVAIPPPASAPVAVRCANVLSCLLFPNLILNVVPLVTASATGTTAISPSALGSLRARASALGTYYATGCPSDPSGAVVFIESASCSFGGGSSYNTATVPGLLVFGSGKATFNGNVTYHGLVYAANRLNLPDNDVIWVTGSALIDGAAMVDGQGGLYFNSANGHLQFNEAIFNQPPQGYGSAGVVDNSWREVLH